MSDRLDFIINTKEDLIEAVHRVGFLPLFRNSLPGFSVEDHVDPSVWFTDEPGVWEWKGPVIQEAGCAYGKFFENKAAFISAEWFPDFANYRRDGYDFDARFDDELASYRDKQLFDLLDARAPVLSKTLKRDGNYKKRRRDRLRYIHQSAAGAGLCDHQQLRLSAGPSWKRIRLGRCGVFHSGEIFRRYIHIRSVSARAGRILSADV